MPDIKVISSRENRQFRYVKSLHSRKTAEQDGVVFLEGMRLCEDALLSGLKPVMILFSDTKKALASDWCERFSVPSDTEFLSMTQDLFERLAGTENPQGVAMLVKSPLLEQEIPVRGNDLYLVCEGTSDPGNLGTMIRMADAFAFTAVILTEGTVDPFNEKVLRASMGSCFHIPIVSFPTISAICENLRINGVQLIGTHLNGEPLPSAEISFPAAVFIGNEARGLSQECADLCDVLVKIPMPGHAESLNAASAASILGYELQIRRSNVF
jgi:TrmH family RNA methyltransferase